MDIHLGNLLSRHARYRPDHLCLVYGERRWHYKAFNEEVNRLANSLISLGLKKGDKFATVLSNCPELMMAYWAAAKTGLVIVPASPLLQSAGLTNLIIDSDTSLLIADAKLADTFNAITPALENMGTGRCIAVGGSIPGFTDIVSLVAAADDSEPDCPGLTGGDNYNIFYTSGTTGAPKGIVHTHFIRAMYSSLFANSFRMTPESVVLHAGAIVFNGAMLDLMPWMNLGATYILHAAFDPVSLMQDAEREGVTHIVMVPSQIVALLDHPDFAPERLESLEMILSVGAPLLLEHKARLNKALPGRFYELYGLTEGFVTILDKQDSMRKSGSVGCPPPFYEMRIVDASGIECAAGEVGEICGRGPIMMKEYYKRPELTAKTIVDGWLHSGDLGYVDDEGFLFLVDRKKDLIISGGINVYPKDIEEVAIAHPEVRDVAVFGIADEKWGETLVAAVVLHKDAEVGSDELCEWINERVAAKYQRISGCMIMVDFPRNVAGKTLKTDLRERYLEMLCTH